MARTVFVIFNWDDERPKAVSAWSKIDKAEGELSKLQEAAPESVLYILPTTIEDLTTVDSKE